MALSHGAVTYTASNADHREILRALYVYFNSGADPHWTIDPAVTKPTQISAAGDAGFALVSVSGAQILIADHAAVGGLCVDAGALNAADDLVVALVPSGGATNMTGPGFAAGASFSGWAVDCQGQAYNLHAGKAKISSDADWLFVRFKVASNSQYDGGFFAGKLKRVSSGIGAGWAVMGGLWTDFASYNSSNNDHQAYLPYGTAWTTCRCMPSDAGGAVGNHATDGAGNFQTFPVMVVAVDGSVSSTITSSQCIGALPAMFAAANGMLAVEWSDAGTVIGYNITGGSWVARDDGSTAE
jgi:hypothetical protein